MSRKAPTTFSYPSQALPRDEAHLKRRLEALGPVAKHELAIAAVRNTRSRAAQRIAHLAKARAQRRRKRKATGR